MTNDAAGEHRNAIAAATSAGSPSRPAGVAAALRSRSAGPIRFHAAVSTGPGSTAFTRTAGAYSTASCRARDTSAPLVAAYAGRPGRPKCACTDDTSTAAPPRSVSVGRHAPKPR